MRQATCNIGNCIITSLAAFRGLTEILVSSAAKVLVEAGGGRGGQRVLHTCARAREGHRGSEVVVL